MKRFIAVVIAALALCAVFTGCDHDEMYERERGMEFFEREHEMEYERGYGDSGYGSDYGYEYDD